MDRVAIVTGATRGIGRATPIRLARDFGAMALVALVARTQETVTRAVNDSGNWSRDSRDEIRPFDAHGL